MNLQKNYFAFFCALFVSSFFLFSSFVSIENSFPIIKSSFFIKNYNQILNVEKANSSISFATVRKEGLFETKQTPSILIQDKDFDTFFKTFITMCANNNVKEYSKAFYKMKTGELLNEEKLTSLKKWTAVPDNKFNEILTNFKVENLPLKEVQEKTHEGDEEWNSFLLESQEWVSVSFNRGAGGALFAKTQDKWYFVTGF